MEQKSSEQVQEINHETSENHIEEEEEYVNHDLMSFPPGYRFVPSDQELIICYLQPKSNKTPLPPNLMHEINIYKHNPDILTENYVAQGDKEWYFFTSRDKKYPKGHRPDRKAEGGYWKATGADKPIIHNGIQVGSKMTLAFYKGKAPKGIKASWIMHEFRLNGPSQVDKNSALPNKDISMRLDDYVLCKIYKKKASGKKKSRQEDEVESETGVGVENDQVEANKDSEQAGIMELEGDPNNVMVPSHNAIIPVPNYYNNNTNIHHDDHDIPMDYHNHPNDYINQDIPNYHHGMFASHQDANMIHVNPNPSWPQPQPMPISYSLPNNNGSSYSSNHYSPLLNRYYRLSEPMSSHYSPCYDHHNPTATTTSNINGHHHNSPYHDHHNPTATTTSNINGHHHNSPYHHDHNSMATTSNNGHHHHDLPYHVHNSIPMHNNLNMASSSSGNGHTNFFADHHHGPSSSKNYYDFGNNSFDFSVAHQVVVSSNSISLPKLD